MKIKFDSEPEFADLWDACVHNLLYDRQKYVGEILSLFGERGIDNSSRILDSCAGTGFISLYLRENEFNVDCMDLMEDQIRVFKKRAKALGVSDDVEKRSWAEIPERYARENYDFVFCRGNSFIYAGGGWNRDQKVERDLGAFAETLKNFYDVLKVGGFLYIDKYPDGERPHKDVVAKVRINEKEEDLIFYTNRVSEKGFREASMLLRDGEGRERGVMNRTYDLKEEELERMVRSVGFRKIERLSLESEKNFVVWLAQK